MVLKQESDHWHYLGIIKQTGIELRNCASCASIMGNACPLNRSVEIGIVGRKIENSRFPSGQKRSYWTGGPDRMSYISLLGILPPPLKRMKPLSKKASTIHVRIVGVFVFFSAVDLFYHPVPLSLKRVLSSFRSPSYLGNSEWLISGPILCAFCIQTAANQSCQ